MAVKVRLNFCWVSFKVRLVLFCWESGMETDFSENNFQRKIVSPPKCHLDIYRVFKVF